MKLNEPLELVRLTLQEQGERGEGLLLPFQGEFAHFLAPRAMPWAECLLAFQAVRYHSCQFYQVIF